MEKILQDDSSLLMSSHSELAWIKHLKEGLPSKTWGIRGEVITVQYIYLCFIDSREQDTEKKDSKAPGEQYFRRCYGKSLIHI